MTDYDDLVRRLASSFCPQSTKHSVGHCVDAKTCGCAYGASLEAIVALREQVATLQQVRDDAVRSMRECETRMRTAEADNAALLSTLKELRIRFHAMGRRPEECYEMSLIDAAMREGKGGEGKGDV